MTGIDSPVDGIGRVIIAAAGIWSVRPEFLQQRIADRIEIEPVLGDKGARLDYDIVDVLDHFEALVEILGGLGITDDTIVARLFREVRPFRIYDGPSEVHRWSIAQRVLRNAGAR